MVGVNSSLSMSSRSNGWFWNGIGVGAGNTHRLWVMNPNFFRSQLSLLSRFYSVGKSADGGDGVKLREESSRVRAELCMREASSLISRPKSSKYFRILGYVDTRWFFYPPSSTPPSSFRFPTVVQSFGVWLFLLLCKRIGDDDPTSIRVETPEDNFCR